MAEIRSIFVRPESRRVAAGSELLFFRMALPTRTGTACASASNISRRRRLVGSQIAKTGRRASPLQSSYVIRSRHPRAHGGRGLPPRPGIQLWRARQRRRTRLRPRRELFLLGQLPPQSVWRRPARAGAAARPLPAGDAVLFAARLPDRAPPRAPAAGGARSSIGRG